MVLQLGLPKCKALSVIDGEGGSVFYSRKEAVVSAALPPPRDASLQLLPLFFIRSWRGAACGGRAAFLHFFCLVVGADCERMGWEGHDRGRLPGHRGHEVRVAFLREVRKTHFFVAAKKKTKGHLLYEECMYSSRTCVTSRVRNLQS